MPDIVKNHFIKIFGPNADSDYQLLLEQYSESHRFYHTLHHIEDCLKKYEEVEDKLQNKETVLTALLFHDIIYNPRQKENEEKSAEYAEEILLNFNFEDQFISRVKDLILLTRHPSKPQSLDDKYLIDIDLSILGAERDIYEVYEENIRKEYSHVPKLLYKIGRSKLLKSFLKEEKIFQTDTFHDPLDSQARANLEWALHNL